MRSCSLRKTCTRWTTCAATRSRIEASDGAWAGIEVKIGHNQVEKAAASLLRLSEKIKSVGGQPPAFLMVLEGLGDYAYRRVDGVYVVPIATLAP